MHRAVAGRLGALAAATLIGGLTIVHPPLVHAATPGLAIVTQATYSALPAEGRVHVAFSAVATNGTPDPASGRYYYAGARFALQPAVRNIRAASGGAALSVRVVQSSAEFTDVEVSFGHAIFHDQSYSFTVSFDITDPGGAPQRDVRVARSLVAFPVWAFGSDTTPGSTVRVVVPAGYLTTVEVGQMTKSGGSGAATVLTAASIPDPFAFFAYVSGEGPGAFRDNDLDVVLPQAQAAVRVRTWDDDPDWGAWVSDTLTRGLPVLQQMIGLEYDVGGTLVVEEAAASRLQDYAGEYHDATKTIDLRYDADGLTALHETAHVWFNDRLFTQRWIVEAWAEWYAVQAGTQLKVSGKPFVVTPQLRKHRVALNAWGAIGVENADTELYAYAASYDLAGQVASRTDLTGLRTVWHAAANHERAYQPRHAAKPETAGSTSESWQYLLDLLEERTGATYSDIWLDLVVTNDQRPEIAIRSQARADYLATVDAAGSWDLPPVIRTDMSAWHFDAAESLMTDARAVLADRERIASQATTLHLTPPSTLRGTFETGAGLEAAQDEASRELTALGAIAAAQRALDTPSSPIESVGLLFASPATDLDAARSAFQRGDGAAATTDAHDAWAVRANAAQAGRVRVVGGGGALLAVDGLGLFVFLGRRRRARRRRDLDARVVGSPPAAQDSIEP